VNAEVILFRLTREGSHFVDETVSNSDGNYVFTNLTQTSEYLVKVVFNDILHSKYVLLDNFTEENFTFSGRIKVQVIGFDEINRDRLELKLNNIFGENVANTTTDSEGIGIFESIDFQDTYYVSLDYRKITFTGLVDFENKSFTETQIEIFESTQSDEDFQVAIQHIIISEENSELSVRETITVQNTGGKVFNTSWLQGWIPESAYDISHNTMDCCIQFYPSGDYAYDPMAPLFPNASYGLSLNYKLEAITPTQNIEKKVIYDTEKIFFLLKRTEKIEAENITGVNLVGVESYGENEYYLFEGSALSAGDLIQIRITTEVSILERISVNPDVLDDFQIFIPLIFVILFFLYQKRKNRLSSTQVMENEFIEALVDAEVEFLEGEISIEELEQIKEEAESAFFKILENQEKEITEQDESRMTSLMNRTRQKVADRVLETISEDLKEKYITKETYQIIYTKYKENR
jgi:hypothetical protein